MRVDCIDIMIGGAHKSGTSSLKDLLSQHPEVCSHGTREFTYFVNEDEFQRGYAEVFSEYFGNCEPFTRSILAKSVGVMYLYEAARRVNQHNSEILFVVMLRNPVERAYSAYWFARQMGLEDIPDFEKALHADPSRFGGDWIRERTCAYLKRGEYDRFIPPLRELFGERMMVYLIEDLIERPEDLCCEVLARVGLDDCGTLDYSQRSNPGRRARSEKLARAMRSSNGIAQLIKLFVPGQWRKKLKQYVRKINREDAGIPPINEDTRVWLSNYYRSHNENLSRLIDRDLSHWQDLTH